MSKTILNKTKDDMENIVISEEQLLLNSLDPEKLSDEEINEAKKIYLKKEAFATTLLKEKANAFLQIKSLF